MVSIGGGGFTLPGYVEHTRPASENTVLEIDRELIEIGREELSLSDQVQVVAEDARISLRDIPERSADVVVGDAYSGASVPWHLTTVEFNSQIEAVMKRDGLYVMNVIDYGDLDFIRSEAATLETVFSEVALFAPPSYLAGEAGGNFILVAANRPLDMQEIETAIQRRGGTEHGISGDRLAEFIGDAPILEDDYAPVDQMLGRP
jgi:spermidine synthase